MSQNAIHPWDYFWINLDEGVLKMMGEESAKLYKQVCRLEFCQNGEKDYKYSIPLSDLRKIKETRPNKFVKVNENTEARRFRGGMQVRIINGNKPDLATFTKEEFQRIGEYL